MDALTIAAASGLRARMESLELLANNLANASTPGYKADREAYGLYVSPEAGPWEWWELPAVLPVIERSWVDFTSGRVVVTGNPLDLALEGRGFFAVEGPEGTLYTRNGSFRVLPSGILATAEGYPVRRVGGGYVSVDAHSGLEVLPDGTVLQGAKAAGRIEVADFKDYGQLKKAGGGYFRLAGTTQVVAASGVRVRQGHLEGSNVSEAEGAVRLVSILRQFEMLQRAVQLGSEMNRKAVEEVARLGG